MNELQNRRRALMALGNGGDGMKITSYTTTTKYLKDAINAANVPLLGENEILFWNIRGTVQQTSGSAAVKCGIAIVQNGRVVTNCATDHDMASVTAPDSATPSSGWYPRDVVTVSNGHYAASTNLYVGIGNVIDFIQIPYNVGWNV